MARSTAKKTASKTASKKTAARKPAPADDPTLTTSPEQPNEEGALQHPALADSPKPEVEVAERSQDVEKGSASAHRKVYVLLKRDYEGGDKREIHRANVEAARQALMSQGLRPTGDGKFVSASDHPDGVSVNLNYDVPAVPAVVALAETGEQAVTHAHVTLDDQHDAEKAEKASSSE